VQVVNQHEEYENEIDSMYSCEEYWQYLLKLAEQETAYTDTSDM